MVKMKHPSMDVNIDTKHTGFPTLKPSSWAQAYTAALLPTPEGPVISTVLHKGSHPPSSDPASPWKSPQSQEPAQKDSHYCPLTITPDLKTISEIMNNKTVVMWTTEEQQYCD